MGMVQIYCGDGKGKTTAAIGQAIRFAGAGGKVLFYQFMKPETSSERTVLQKIPEITVLSGYFISKFSFCMTDTERMDAAIGYQKQFSALVQMAVDDAYGMLIMDELFSCISCGFLSSEQVQSFLFRRPEDLEVVMTGRNPEPCFLEIADYISEIRSKKHPYERGIQARKGIEF